MLITGLFETIQVASNLVVETDIGTLFQSLTTLTEKEVADSDLEAP